MSHLHRSSRRRVSRLVVAALAIAVFGATACSSDDDSSTGTETAGMIGPIIVEEGQTEVSAPVGRMIVFNAPDPANTVISSSDETVIAVTAGYDDGSAIFNPGGEALAPGTATITIEPSDGSGETWTIEVTVTE